jgi:predicted phosphoribosyltransferase
MQSLFRDRREAGRLLAEKVASSIRAEDALVLGLPRGGVEVAYEIARILGAPLDVFVLRKLELRGEHDLAIGSIAAGGVRVLDSATIAALDLPEGVVEELARRQAVLLARIERYYRDRRPAPRMMDRTIVLVDDGLSEPSYLRAAVEALRAYRPARVVVAVPAATAETCAELGTRVGELLYVVPPEAARGASVIYDDDAPVSDRDVRHILLRAASHGGDHRLAG